MEERSDKHLEGKHDAFSACAEPVEAVRLAAKQWQEFLESSPDPMWIKDTQGRYVAVNKAYLRADPGQTQDVIGKTDFEVQSRDRAEMYVADDQVAIHDGVCEHEFSAVDQEGNLKYYNTKKTALHDPDGLLTGVLGQARDITSQRRLEVAADLYNIIEAAGKAQSMGEFLPKALTIALAAASFEGGDIYLVDGDHAVLVCATGLGSELTERIRSVPVDEQPYRAVLREGKPTAFTELDLLPPGIFQQHGVSSMISVPIVAGDTVVGALNLASAHTQNAELRTDLLMSIGRTIGEAIVRLRADESLRTSRQDFETLFEIIPRLVFVLREDGRIARINTAAAERLGWKVDELCETSVLDLCPPDRQAEAACIVADMIAGKTSLCTLSLVSREGELIQVETRVVRTTWGGKPAIFGVSRELTSHGLDEEYAELTVLNDELTGLYSASGFSAIASQQLKMAHRGHINAALVVTEIVSGADAGPPELHMLADFAGVLRQTFRDSDTIGRIGTARFGVLAIQTDNTCLDLLAQRLQESVANLNAQRSTDKPELVARIVVTPVDAMRPALLDDLMSQAGTQLNNPD